MELQLPPGNYLEPDPDLLVLRKRAKVDFVAALNVQDATNESLEQAAWKDYLQRTSLEFVEPTAQERERSKGAIASLKVHPSLFSLAASPARISAALTPAPKPRHSRYIRVQVGVYGVPSSTERASSSLCGTSLHSKSSSVGLYQRMPL